MMNKYIELLLKDAQKAFNKEEVPISSLIVDSKGQILVHSYNQMETKQDATAHTEILSIKKASQKINNWRLIDTTLYVTLEPCVMCAEAIHKSRIKKIIYLEKSNNLTELERTFLDNFYKENNIEIKQYENKTEYLKLLQLFFEEKRKK